ncbi:prefoldin subunit alpha [Candidatus Pacearchaeota archaeon]|nr:prefoldin subunit alpha [Candidatus Pacearchaeota archaeon]
MEKNSQELLFKISMFEQHIENLRQQLSAVKESLVYLESLNLGLNDIKDSKGKEILASIGKGIFVKAQLISEELILDVGGKNFVKKDIPETKKIIGEQIKKLQEIKKELEEKLEEINKEMISLLLSARENKEK